jgi:hypothetical protein
MKTIRKKIIDLLDEFPVQMEWHDNADLANFLLSHGVTVQECGHWEDDHGDYVCSCCHTVFTDDIVWLVRGESNEPNYCPHCGAKMMPQPPKGE